MASSPIRLSVLDQAPVPSGSTPSQALANSVSLAQHVDRLGYHRLWYSEHHAMPLLAGAAPELLIARAGAATSRIRIGSGGIMLPHYAAFKVAELFRTLDAFYPGRIDLGIGRAPGGGQLESQALRRTRAPMGPDDFLQQLAELLAFLHPEVAAAAFPADHPFARIHVAPAPPEPTPTTVSSPPESEPITNLSSRPKAEPTTNLSARPKAAPTTTVSSRPEAEGRSGEIPALSAPTPPQLAGLSPDVWLLGSSMWSAATAAAQALPYAFAHFFSAATTRQAIEHYHRSFEPSPWRTRPEATIAIGVIVADTQAEADHLHQSVRLLQRRIRSNDRRPVATPEEATLELAQLPRNPNPLLAFASGTSRLSQDAEPETEFPRYITGTPATVRDKLLHITHELELSELIINTITHSHEARLKSYTLLAEAFGLQ